MPVLTATRGSNSMTFQLTSSCVRSDSLIRPPYYGHLFDPEYISYTCSIIMVTHLHTRVYSATMCSHIRPYTCTVLGLLVHSFMHIVTYDTLTIVYVHSALLRIATCTCRSHTSTPLLYYRPHICTPSYALLYIGLVHVYALLHMHCYI